MKPTQCATCRQATESQTDTLSSREGTSGDHGAEVRAWVFKHPILIGAIVGKYAVDGKVNVIKKSRPLMESP